MTRKICISGYYGFDNFGDETILKILIENLKSSFPNALITVFSVNPKKTESLLNVKSIHSFKILELLITILKSDVLISGGGSLLQDATSPKSLVYYLLVLIAAQLFGKKTVIFAQGIGPVNNPILAKITSRVLKNASFISVRDDNSLNLLSKWGVNALKCCDPVWNLNIQKTEKTGIIAIQLRSWKDMTNENFLNKLAVSINNLYSEKEIHVLSLQNEIDMPICNAFAEHLVRLNPLINVKVIENTSHDNVIKEIIQAEELIAMRYHACLAAIKANIRLFPISYDIKVDNLAKNFGLDYTRIENCECLQQSLEQFKNTDIEYNNEKIRENMFDFEMLRKAL